MDGATDVRTVVVIGVVLVVALSGCIGGDGSASMGNGNDGNLGYTVGGAQDVNNFRDNVDAGYLPIPTDMTHEGLFSEYYFDTGMDQPCEELFCPGYTRAVTNDPLSNETEYYASVGLNSNIPIDEFERRPLNLIVVLDVSGSMGSAMDRYYYDGEGEPPGQERVSKITAATDAVATLYDQLGESDRFGFVTYGDSARTAVEFGSVAEQDRSAIRETIRSQRAGGSTNIHGGMERARSMLGNTPEDDGYDTRIVYVTDAQPNVGLLDASTHESELAQDADRGIHSTFVGVGMDFNSAFVEAVGTVRGANYFAVHSAERFEERMGEEFEYMVTPMVYDLELAIESNAYDIEAVYGSPDADAATGRVMHVNTLFPSPSENGSTKGGIVLVQLDRDENAADGTAHLTASYEDRSGTSHENVATIEFDDLEPDYYEDSAVRKAVALSRYASLMQSWAEYEHALESSDSPEEPTEGIEVVDDLDLGQWERQSVSLRVSDVYADRMAAFETYFEAEVDAIDDETLTGELEVIETILATSEQVSAAGETDEGGPSTNELAEIGAENEAATA